MTAAAWSGEMIEARSNGRTFTLHVLDRGRRSDPPILFLHGFPTSSLDWRKVAPFFADRRAIYVDLLGFGRSDKPALRYSYPLQADLVQSLLTSLGVRRCDIVAHDYSVTLAQELLRRDGEGDERGRRVDRVALLNGGVYGRLHRLQRFHRMLLTPVVGRLFAARLDPKRLRAGLDAIAGERGAWSLACVADHLAAMRCHRGLWRLPDLVHYIADRERYGAAWERAMERAEDRVGFVWGPADPVSGAHVLDEIRRRMPHARVHALEHVGHYPHWEAPWRTAAALLDVLARA